MVAPSPAPPGDEPLPYEAERFGRPAGGWRRRLFSVIFESDTRAGRLFDLGLLLVILASVAIVMADSIGPLGQAHQALFDGLEWAITLLFTVEYAARLACVERPLRYARSFFGIVDLLAVLPTYLALVSPGFAALVNIRALRLLRMFRILKLTAYISEYRVLGRALRASSRRILVFIATVLLIVVLLGTLMYLVEGPANGFTSIPMSIYWAVTTVTTVGFGDITPRTDLGRALASFMMLLGWGILAVPTGIVTAEITAERFGVGSTGRTTRRCAACGAGEHLPAARFCQACGAPLAGAG